MKKYVTGCLVLLLSLPTVAMDWLGNKAELAQVDIKLVNNLIIVPVRLNGSKPLNFILDTGVRNLIITELFQDDLLSFNYAKTTKLNGLGDGEPVEAFYSPSNVVSVKGVLMPNVDVYVLKEDVFSLSKNLGLKVNGIIGYDFFKNHIVEIDYRGLEISLYDPNTYSYDLDYAVPLSLENKKPYVQASYWVGNQDTLRQGKFLIDTGGSFALWLSELNDPQVYVPPKHIDSFLGKGLNGDLHGQFARIHRFAIADHLIGDVVCSFPDVNSVKEAYLKDKRVGSICGDFLRRFTLLVDYPNRRISLDHNIDVYKPFDFNHLGINLYQPIPHIRFYLISHIRENSEAFKSGLREDDRIVSIDGYQLHTMSLQEVNDLIFRLYDEKVRIVVTRGEERMVKEFYLRAVI